LVSPIGAIPMVKKKTNLPPAITNEKLGSEFPFNEAMNLFLPGVSVNIVVFNYRNGKLKVLIMRLADTQHYMLPGGYVMKEEDLDNAAARIFNEWSGLQGIQLQQFYTSGKADRVNDPKVKDIIEKNLNLISDPWFAQRKISVCYFALLNEPEINSAKIDFFVSEHQWINISDIPALLFDHSHIIEKAVQNVQLNLDHLLITQPLFKEEFTMRELQRFYEAVFQRSLTRTNFQRRMLNLNILERSGKQYTGKAHKAPYLYRFRND